MLECHRFRYHLIITIQPTTPTTLVCVEIILGAAASAVRSIERKKETRHNAFKKLKHLQFINQDSPRLILFALV